MTTFDVLNTLRKRFGLKDVRAGVYDALCPAHEDRNRSLRVYKRADGNGLYFHCYAGCDWVDVHKSLGLPTGLEFRSAAPRRSWLDTPAAPEPKREPRYNFDHLNQMFAVTIERAGELAEQLGVSAAALAALELGRANNYPMHVASRNADAPQSCWTFPMFDGGRNVVGLRTRYADGAKRSWTGSAPGLFLPTHWQAPGGPLVIVEGPTDAAAVIDWGFDVIGRPSCGDGGALILAMLITLYQKNRRDVVILSNLDAPKARPDGTTFCPGQDGAAKLADLIAWRCKTLRVICPPRGIKDARQWLAAGGTRRDVLAMIDSKRAWKVEPKQRRTA